VGHSFLNGSKNPTHLPEFKARHNRAIKRFPQAPHAESTVAACTAATLGFWSKPHPPSVPEPPNRFFIFAC